ncbi:unnamed protein product [Leptosia nina]|uniref:Uncharacterized protein n=1 Tax=Leptosia nina TaxID=320188 RepID=A0AAV1ITB0_9NEOP
MGYRKFKKSNLENPEVIIEKIASHLKIADKITASKCTQYNNPRETYDYEGYILKYTLPHELEEFVNVKIKNNMMFIKAKMQQSQLSDIKILQHNLETRDAIWWIDGEDLTISMPNRIKDGVYAPMKCEDREIDIDVPLSPEYSVYQFLHMNIYEKPIVTNV